jgi:hypothetical protein
MTTILAPRGWSSHQIETRFVTAAPSSFDESTRSVDAIISMGSPVVRFYGTEVLRISEDAIDTKRVMSGHCPLLDIGWRLARARSRDPDVDQVWRVMGQAHFQSNPGRRCRVRHGRTRRTKRCVLRISRHVVASHRRGRSDHRSRKYVSDRGRQFHVHGSQMGTARSFTCERGRRRQRQHSEFQRH